MELLSPLPATNAIGAVFAEGGRLQSVEQMAAGCVVSVAKSIEGLVRAIQVKLEQKPRWLNIGLSFIGAAFWY